MYLEYFSLKRHPFRITPDPSLFFPGGSHGRGVVLDALVYGITSGEGILKVVGEVGSGKTMLCRMLEEKLPKSIEIVYLANPSLSARDIIYAIAIELELDVDAATDRLLVMHKLQEYLLRKHGEGGSVVVFIEEAQSMPLETLEEVRLLSNLETHRHKLMQIVLFGQPELEKKLEQKSIRQLRERITHSFYLAPLNTEEIRAYLRFRLQSAGCPWPQLFSPKAEALLAQASEGLNRRINILADKSLLAAYADPATRPESRNSAGEILPMVLPRHVKTAVADSGYKTFGRSQSWNWLGYFGAALGGALVVALSLWLWTSNSPKQTSPVVASVVAPVSQIQASQISVTPADPEPVVAVTEPGIPVDLQIATTDSVLNSSQNLQVETAAQAALPKVEPVTVSAKPAAQEPSLLIAQPVPEKNQAELTPVNNIMAVQRQEQKAAQEAAQEVAQEVAQEDVKVNAEVEVTVEPKVEPKVEAKIEKKEESQLLSTLPGLTRIRVSATQNWLKGLQNRTGYSVQLYSVTTANSDRMEEFLEFLQLAGLLDDSYVCLISGNSRRQEQWLVLHGEYRGLSDARQFISGLPPYIKQHAPYARNLNGIACSDN